MRTCVVTGGAGFLVCIDNLETGSLQDIDHIRYAQFDFRNIEITDRVDIAEDVDLVCHLALPASPLELSAPTAAHAQDRLLPGLIGSEGEERQASEINVAVNDSLARASIERASIERPGDGAWAAPDGRQTSAAAEAPVWALVLLAE